MGHKDKGRKGDKGKGKKHDRAKDEASMSTPAAAAQTAPKAPRPRVSAPKVAARQVATARLAAPKAQAAEVDRPVLPSDRASLLALHQAARRRRDAAPLLSRDRARASFEIEWIEVQIARVERALDPPLV